MRKYVLLVFLWSLCGASEITKIDDKLYHQIHDKWRCDFADYYFSAASQAGNAEVYLATNLALSLWGNDKMRESSRLSTTAYAISMGTTILLKTIINRKRPEYPDEPSWNSSFPSGHATGTFSMVYIYSREYPKLAVPLYIFAVSVAVSRVYNGCHWPSDVVAGAIIGTAGGVLVWQLRESILSFEFRF